MPDHPHTTAMDMPLPIDMRAPSLGKFSVWYRKPHHRV